MKTSLTKPRITSLGAPLGYILAVVFLIAFSPSSLQGEDDAGPTFTTREIKKLTDLPELPKRQMRAAGEIAFAIFSFGKNGEDYFYLRNEKPEKLFFNTGVIRRFQYGGVDGRVVIYKKSVNEEGKDVLLPIAHLTPPAGSRDGIAIFRPDKEDGAKKVQKLTFIDLSKNAFRANDLRLVNMTTRPLVVKLNDKTVKLAPLGDVTRPLRVNASIFPVKVGIVRGKKLKLIYSNVYQSEPKNRTLFMIVPDWTKSSAGSPIRCMIYKDTGSVSG